MSAPTTIRRELLNIAFLSFIPAGELVDAVTVSATTWPDNTPTTNWTAYQIPDVESLTLVKEYDSETFKVPKTSGGYFEDVDSTLKKVSYKGKTSKTSSYFKRLENGLATVPVVGTAQSPFVDNNNFIEGVFLIEIQNKNGAVTERMQLWGRLRLENPGDTGPATRKLEFSIEKRDSGNNSYVLVA
jgi:hypothetical protein